MSILLPRRQYILRAIEEMDQRDALLLRMRWGLDDGKPSRIAYLAAYFNLSRMGVMEELKRVECQVLKQARELEDQYEMQKA